MQTSCGSRSVTASNAYAFLQRGNYDAFALCAASEACEAAATHFADERHVVVLAGNFDPDGRYFGGSSQMDTNLVLYDDVGRPEVREKMRLLTEALEADEDFYANQTTSWVQMFADYQDAQDT